MGPAMSGASQAVLPDGGRDTGTRPGPPPRREILKLGLLFGAVYFIQGIGEPTEGLIAQPVRSLLKSWNYGDARIATFAALLALPWSLKPLYGLLTDFVPLAGYRRKSYLVLTSAVTAVSLGLLYRYPPPAGAYYGLLAILLVPTVGVAFSDVVADALMVEKGQPRGLTGQLQAVQWAAMYAATLLTGFLGGYLTEHHHQPLGFLICAGVTAVTLVLALLCVREEPGHVPARDFRGDLRLLKQAARSPTVLGVAAFLFLWNFNPFSSTVLYLYMTKEMGLSEQFYGNTVSLIAAASLVACVCYGLYCRRVPMAVLVHGSIVLGILATLAYWAMTDEPSAILVSLAVGFTYMTATLIQLDLAARACPPEVAGTVFALFMALENLGNSLSTELGGHWYELGKQAWGSSRFSFNVLVAVGAAFTAGCWALWPLLRSNPAVRGAGGVPPALDPPAPAP